MLILNSTDARRILDAMSENLLSSLKIDYWYKMLPVIGTVTLIVGLTVGVKGVSNTLVQLVSIGVKK